jgi:GTP cyclohydrolase I
MVAMQNVRPLMKSEGAPQGPRQVDLPRAEAAVRELLLALGEDPDREGLIDTPARVARMYQEMFSGLGDEPSRHLRRTFAESCDEAVILKGIAVESVCEHHLLPFIGVAHVAYLPGENVVGLSKLARTVKLFARRPQVQERLTSEIAESLVTALSARGALVRIEAQHMCMRMRGVREHSSRMVTTAARGELRSNLELRREVLEAFRENRGGGHV